MWILPFFDIRRCIETHPLTEGLSDKTFIMGLVGLRVDMVKISLLFRPDLWRAHHPFALMEKSMRAVAHASYVGKYVHPEVPKRLR